MSFEQLHTPIQDVYVIQSSLFSDDRGSFLNCFPDLLTKSLWAPRIVSQVNLCSNSRVGTIRGLHLQSHPYSEAKLVRCIRGCVWDVVADVRPYSPTYGKWFGIQLSSARSNAIFIPEGCAHGYQVLEENSDLLYIHSAPWSKEFETGIIYNDPHLRINWPLRPVGMSDRDKNLPSLFPNEASL